MPGLIGKKIGMTSVFSAEGKNIPCTVIEAGPCVVTQVKKLETDGYVSIQLAFDEKREKSTTKPLKGHFQKAGTTPKAKLVEFKEYEDEFKLGDVVTVDIMEENMFVDITGISKGKGFQGVVKRHGFSGVGETSHGQQDRVRAPGSIGNASFPGRVFRGKKMAGRMGGDRVVIENLRVIKVIPESNLLLIKGSVPGANGSYLIIEK